MCGDTRIPRDTGVGHTIPGETHIPATLVNGSVIEPLYYFCYSAIFEGSAKNERWFRMILGKRVVDENSFNSP